MRITKILLISFLISAFLIYLSFNFPFLPCKKIPNVAGASVDWAFCPFSLTGRAIEKNLYFGRYPASLETLLTIFLFFFIIFFIILAILLRKRRR